MSASTTWVVRGEVGWIKSLSARQRGSAFDGQRGNTSRIGHHPGEVMICQGQLAGRRKQHQEMKFFFKKPKKWDASEGDDGSAEGTATDLGGCYFHPTSWPRNQHLSSTPSGSAPVFCVCVCVCGGQTNFPWLSSILSSVCLRVSAPITSLKPTTQTSMTSNLAASACAPA